MSDEALRAAFRLLAHARATGRITTHYAPEPAAIKRGRGFRSMKDALTRSRNGKLTRARRRR